MSYPPNPGQYGPQPGPYGSQPGWGQPDPHQSGPYPAPGHQGDSQDFWRHVSGGAPPPQLPKKRRAPLIVGLVAAVVAVLAVAATLFIVFTAEDEVVADDCITLASQEGGRMSEAECGSGESDYRVVEVVEGQRNDVCPGKAYNKIDGKTYCMVLDVAVGDCLTPYDENLLPIKADCAQRGIENQVVKVADATDHTKVCAEHHGWYSYENPNMTVCFGEIQRR